MAKGRRKTGGATRAYTDLSTFQLYVSLIGRASVNTLELCAQFALNARDLHMWPHCMYQRLTPKGCAHPLYAASTSRGKREAWITYHRSERCLVATFERMVESNLQRTTQVYFGAQAHIAATPACTSRGHESGACKQAGR